MGDSIMKRFTLLAFASIGLAACDATPTPTAPALKTAPTGAPSFAKLFNERIPLSGTLFNSCAPQEFVAFEGVFHLLITGEQTPTGIDEKIHVNLQSFSGVGLSSGDRYSIQQNEHTDFSFSFVPPFPSEQETDFLFRMIRQGSDDNLWVRVTFRVSSSGGFEIIRNEFECRG